jgi:hypothetical protein
MLGTFCSALANREFRACVPSLFCAALLLVTITHMTPYGIVKCVYLACRKTQMKEFNWLRVMRAQYLWTSCRERAGIFMHVKIYCAAGHKGGKNCNWSNVVGTLLLLLERFLN